MKSQNKELGQFKKVLKLAPCNERGIILMITLVMLVMVTLIGLASIRTSSTDVKLGGNERISKEVLFAAESGIQHARRLIKGVGFANAVAASPPASTTPWLTVDDFNGIRYTVNASTINSRGISAPDNTVFLTAQATYENGYTRTIEAEVFNPIDSLPINYGLGAVGNFSRIRFQGTAVVDGNLPDGTRTLPDGTPIPAEAVDATGVDQCAQNKAGAAVDTMAAYDAIEIQNSTNVTGSPDTQLRAADMTPTMVQDLSADMAQYADRTYNLSDINDNTTIFGDQNWGTATDPQVTSINMTGDDVRTVFGGNVKGHGILIINADNAMSRAEIKFNANFEWHGLIIVTGKSRFRLRDEDGSNTQTTIIGALLAANTLGDGLAGEQVRLRMSSTNTLVQYSCDAISGAAAGAASIILNSWHEISTIL